MDKNKVLDRNRLGRGLSALIPPTVESIRLARPVDVSARTETQESAQEVSVTSIVPNSLQPRTAFAPEALEELAASIAAHGILQPLLVRPRGAGHYELIAGERRFRAAQKAGLSRVPVVVREMTDAESLAAALIENIQRADLNAIEAARGYQQLLEEFGLTQQELAGQIGKSQSTIAHALSLLRLALPIQESISFGQISPEHGKVLLSITDVVRRERLFQYIVRMGLSVSEARAQALDGGATVPVVRPAADKPEPDVYVRAIEDRMRAAIGLKVSIRSSKSGRGTVSIEFSNADELETIIDNIAKS